MKWGAASQTVISTTEQLFEFIGVWHGLAIIVDTTCNGNVFFLFNKIYHCLRHRQWSNTVLCLPSIGGDDKFDMG